MENILVSIIVPVYNTEMYVGYCIESLVNQSYKNIEIILVNDGSSDKSIVILKKFQEQDKRIKLIDRENKGSIYSRLEGYNKASGSYVMFIDSDDWIDENTVKDALHSILKYNADILRFNMIKEFTSEKRTRKIDGISDIEMCIQKRDFGKKLYPLFLNSYKLNSMCAELIRKDAVVLNPNLDDYDVRMGDDLLCNIDIIDQVNSFVVYPMYFYHYRYTENSITTMITFEKMKSNIDDTIRVYGKFENYQNMWSDNAEVSKNEVAKKILAEVIAALRPLFINKFKLKEKKELINYARKKVSEKNAFYGQKLDFLENIFVNNQNLFLLYETVFEGGNYLVKTFFKKVLYIIKKTCHLI